MEIRLITIKEDFEKAYNLLNRNYYPLSFYEYSLKHDLYLQNDKLKLIGLFNEKEDCVGSLSYNIEENRDIGRILNIKEIHHEDEKVYAHFLPFLEQVALEENCLSIHVGKNQVDRLNHSVFDRLENYLKKIFH